MRWMLLLFLVACRTSASTSTSTSTATTATTASAAPGTVPRDCTKNEDCVSESCCGPFNAEDKCIAARARRDCDGIVCALMIPSYACACRGGACVTVPSPQSSGSPPAR